MSEGEVTDNRDGAVPQRLEEIQPDKLLKPHEYLTRALQNEFQDTFATKENRESFLKQTSYDSFSKLIDTINGYSRGLPEEQFGKDAQQGIRLMSKEAGFQLVSWEPPALEDRDILLREAFEAAKLIEDNETAATLLGLSLGAIHPYADGNKRTSRMIYSLLTHGYDRSEEDNNYYDRVGESKADQRVIDLNITSGDLYSDILSNNLSGDQTIKILETMQYEGPYIIGYGSPWFAAEPGHLQNEHDLTPDHLSDLFAMDSEVIFMLPIALNFLHERGLPIEDFLTATKSGARQLDAGKFLRNLTNDDVEQLVGIRDRVKRDALREMFKAFSTPQDEEKAYIENRVAYYRPKPVSQPDTQV